MILREGTVPVVIGTVIGLAAAYFSTRLIGSMLYGIAATDPMTFTVLPLALMMVGVLASWIPAMRATRIAPTEALKDG